MSKLSLSNGVNISEIAASVVVVLSPEEWWRLSRIAQARLGQHEYAFLALNDGTLGHYHEDFALHVRGVFSRCNTGQDTE